MPPPACSHAFSEEILYGLDGVLRCRVGDQVRELRPGETTVAPRGVLHGFSNPFEAPARALVVLTPDLGERYFHDIAAVAGAPGGPDPEEMARVMAGYGVKVSPLPFAAD